MSALVSILIPCYNAASYIGRAIESGLSQNHRDVEVLVVDDGSTDDSLGVISRHATDKRVRFETGPNRGGNAARNRLLTLARGEFVQFLDADDFLYPGKLSACLKLMTDEVDMVYSDYVETTKSVDRLVRHSSPTGDLLAHVICNNIPILLPLHRISHLKTVGGFDESLRCCQEYDMHIRLARKAWRRIANVPLPLATVERVPGSVSSNDARVFSTMEEILQRLLASLEDEGATTPDRRQAIGRHLHWCARHLARHRLDDRADSAFMLADRLLGLAGSPYRLPMRILAAVVGPVRAERLRQLLRN